MPTSEGRRPLERWGEAAPREHHCPGILEVRGDELVVGWSSGGCTAFHGVTASETDDRVTVVADLVDSSEPGAVCPDHLQLGVETLTLDGPVDGRRVGTAVRVRRLVGEVPPLSADEWR